MPDLTTREMMEAIDQTPPVRTFLQKTFFPGEQTHITEKVEFDEIGRASRRERV